MHTFIGILYILYEMAEKNLKITERVDYDYFDSWGITYG